MSPKGSSSTTAEEEVVEEAPAEEAPAEPPKPRFFSVALEIQLTTDNQDTSAEAVEAGCKEQIVLPAQIHAFPAVVTVIGVTSGGVSESDTPTEIDDGYGRAAPPKEEE